MTGFLTVFEREIARFLKVIVQTILSPLVSSFLYLLIFGVSLGEKMGETSRTLRTRAEEKGFRLAQRRRR